MTDTPSLSELVAHSDLGDTTRHARTCDWWVGAPTPDAPYYEREMTGELRYRDCTCSLRWREMVRTEREMHNAWRKRAEEAEGSLSRLSGNGGGNGGEPLRPLGPEEQDLIASVICKSGKFETGEGTCALICMDQLGSARAKPCPHARRVHRKLAESIASALLQATAGRGSSNPIDDGAVERGARKLVELTPLILDGYSNSIYSEKIKADWRERAESIARAVLTAALLASQETTHEK